MQARKKPYLIDRLVHRPAKKMTFDVGFVAIRAKLVDRAVDRRSINRGPVGFDVLVLGSRRISLLVHYSSFFDAGS
jgi:hypothetical protein